MRHRSRAILAVTMGDPAGVGPELCLRALAPDAASERIPVLFGDMGVLERVHSVCGVPMPTDLDVIGRPVWDRGFLPQRATIVDLGAIGAASIEPGAVSGECGAAAAAYVRAAVEAAITGRADAVVTAPLNKEALHAAGVPYPGHTEMLTALSGATSSCMMLTAPSLSVSFVTGHRSLASVPQSLTVARVLEVIRLTASAVGQLGGASARAPSIGVCGLNPHAGEHGLFGEEEGRIIEPAIEHGRAEGIEVSGPLPPDTAFIEHVRHRFDAIVCMYHDQGHIPFKMLAFDEGVNVTLGLRIIRTSVDHGTAFDIAWKGVARPSSLFAALSVAERLAAAVATAP